jgi:hypothetical protein
VLRAVTSVLCAVFRVLCESVSLAHPLADWAAHASRPAHGLARSLAGLPMGSLAGVPSSTERTACWATACGDMHADSGKDEMHADACTRPLQSVTCMWGCR